MEPTLLQTKYGTIAITPTNASHAYVELKPPFDVRGVNYTGSIHMYKWSDDTWHYGTEYSTERHRKGEKASTYERRQAVWLKREDWLSRTGVKCKLPNGKDQPSDAAWNLIVAEVAFRACQWLEANPRVLYQAEVQSLEREAESAEAELQKKMRELEAAKDVCTDILKRLGKLRQPRLPEDHEH